MKKCEPNGAEVFNTNSIRKYSAKVKKNYFAIRKS